MSAQENAARAREEPAHQQRSQDSEPPKKRKKAAPISLSAMWYEWYTREPRLWECGDKNRRSDGRHVTAYMRLFLTDGYVLLESSDTYRDEVLALGKSAEAALIAFLRSLGKSAASYGTVLREMRALHHAGELDERIATFRALRLVERIVDPSPKQSLDVLAPRNMAIG